MARKSKKVDYINIKDTKKQNMALSSVPKQIYYKAGLYARLSDETQENRERATIETQMELLRKFVAENNDMVAEKEYFDISCSGTHFDRPGFEEMMQDMRNGLINCIVVKDLSRLGRNYVETGNYIERVFPFFDVRFIAITDGYDSNKSGEELLMPLKNMINEMYVKDLRKKMKTAHRAIWKSGEYSSGAVPYGYVNVNRHLQPDDKVKWVVQEMFHLYLQGNSLSEIARQLSEKVVNPRTYKKMSFGHEIPEEMNTKWDTTTVRFILSNYVYIGICIHNKKEKVNGKLIDVPRERQIVIENDHEPLVSREDFERVQAMLSENVTKFHSTHGKNGFDHAQFNLMGKRIVCADCGNVMGFRTEGRKHDKGFYRCKTYLNTIKSVHEKCTNHKISLDKVNQAVFDTIHEHMKIAIEAERIIKKVNARMENVKKYDIYAKEADRIRKELQKTTEVKSGIFEDYKDNLLDGEQYVQITERYAAKIKKLKAELEEVLRVQAEYFNRYHIDEDWKGLVEKYINKRKLTREMVEAFVEKVVVHENADIEIHLKYDDVLNDLLRLCKEREVV